jgi:hypothetical protein
LRRADTSSTIVPVDDRDEQILFDAIFDIRRDIRLILRLLTEDDEEEGPQEEDS